MVKKSIMACFSRKCKKNVPISFFLSGVTISGNLFSKLSIFLLNCFFEARFVGGVLLPGVIMHVYLRSLMVAALWFVLRSLPIIWSDNNENTHSYTKKAVLELYFGWEKKAGMSSDQGEIRTF